MDHPYYVTMWVPANVALANADSYVRIRAPELNNTNDVGRTQVKTKTRAGHTIVYDQGTLANFDNTMEFKDVPDSERSALIVFLDSVTWGSTIVAMLDHNDNTKYIRVTNQKITSKDTGYLNKYSNDRITLWDFTLDFTDISNTIIEEQDYTVMSTALSLHLTNYDTPHSPEFTAAVDIAEGAKIIDSFKCREYASHIWIGIAIQNAKHHVFQIALDHNGFLVTDATVIGSNISQICDVASSVSDITFTSTLSGTGVTQVVNLRVQTTVDGYVLKLRRIKVGRQY